MKLKIKKLNDKAVMPYKSHENDFAYDLVATSCEEIAPNVYKYGFGLAFELEEAPGTLQGLTIRPRSSIYKTGMILSNSLGTVDEGYRGEVSAVMYHVIPTLPIYKVGDRVAQLHYDRTLPLEIIEATNLSDTERGKDGYGSTGN